MKHAERIFNRSTVTLAALVLLLGVLLAARALSPQQSLPVAQQSVQIPKDDSSVEELQKTTETTGDFFKDFRAQREQARADEIVLLDSIVQRQGAPEESVREADKRKIELTHATEQERMIEKMLIAKGFEDAAAFVTEDIVSIAVKKAELSDNDTAKILELALSYTDQQAENIKIIPVSPH